MGITKTEIFSESQNEIAMVAKVLGHPARIAILEHLFKLETCICGDLVDVIGLAQPTISQHLKELKRVGLIQGNIEGTSVCYCINFEKLEQIQTLFTEFLGKKPKSNSQEDCC